MSAPQPNEYLDQGTRFWMGERDDTTPLSRSREDVDDDVQSAYRESTGRGGFEREIDASQEHLKTLDRVFGSPKAGGEFLIKANDALTADPIRAREHLKREFAKLPPNLAPLKEAPATPPEYLDEKGRREWQRTQDVRAAYRGASQDREWRQKMAEVEPFLTQVWRERGNLNNSLGLAAAAIEAASVNPKIWDKVSEWYGAPATPLAVEEWGVALAQSQQPDPQADYLTGFVGDVMARNILPGLETIEDDVAAEIVRLRSSGQHKGGWQELLVDGYYNVRQRIQTDLDRAAGQRAKQASRSLNAAPSGNDDNRPFTMETTESGAGSRSAHDDARAAYRSITGRNNRV